MTQDPQAGYLRSRLDFLRTDFSGYAGAFIAVAVGVHVAAACFNGGFLNADEHYQIIEFAQYKLGRQSLSALPWEFTAQIRPALQPWLVVVLIRLCRVFGVTTPFTIAFLLRLLSALLALWTSFEVCVRCIRTVEVRWIRVVALCVAFLLWITPTEQARFSSENWGGALLVGGLCLMLDAVDRWPTRRMNAVALGVCAGVVWGAAFYCRFQIGFAIVGAGLWMLVVRRVPFELIAAIAAAFVVGCGLNVVADRWFYGGWMLTPYNYFVENLVHGKAAAFGVSPWWMLAAYMAVLLIPPYSIGLLAILTIGCWYGRRHVLVWMTVPFVVVHAAVGHKEPRFLIPLLYLIGPLLAVCVDALPKRVSGAVNTWLRTAWGRTHTAAWCTINALLLGIAISVPTNDTYRLDRWLWDQSRTGRITVYAVGGSPYEASDTTTNSFYRSEDVSVIPVQSADQIHAFPGAAPAFAYYRGVDAPALVVAAGPCEPVVRTIPAWLAWLEPTLLAVDFRQATICRFSGH